MLPQQKQAVVGSSTATTPAKFCGGLYSHPSK